MIAEAVQAVRSRIQVAAERSRRDPASVRVVAASKSATATQILEAAATGLSEFGENIAQDLRDKHAVIGDAVRWHFLGGLQTNKVRYLDVVELIHSLDRAREAEALQRRGEARGRSWDVLIEVNVAREASKQGLHPEHVEPLLEQIADWPLVRPRGLMVVAPQAGDPDDVRWVFADARKLRDRLREAAPGLQELSMGMTEDFEVAIEEGATIVRVGRAIFQGE